MAHSSNGVNFGPDYVAGGMMNWRVLGSNTMEA
jgi:hypothetical protein